MTTTMTTTMTIITKIILIICRLLVFVYLFVEPYLTPKKFYLTFALRRFGYQLTFNRRVTGRPFSR